MFYTLKLTFFSVTLNSLIHFANSDLIQPKTDFAQNRLHLRLQRRGILTLSKRTLALQTAHTPNLRKQWH